jgi:hypothetical protein
MIDGQGVDLESEDMWTVGVIIIVLIVIIILFIVNP